MQESLIERVSIYIDGFNFYHGLMAKGWGRHRWLDFTALMRLRIREGQELVELKYFTALMTHRPESLVRQQVYLRALEVHTGLVPILGQWEQRDVQCRNCKTWYRRPQEKRTDVNLATHLVADAYEDRFDTAYLICADADLIPAVERVQSLHKNVVLIDPPRRHSSELAALANAHWHVSNAHLSRSQLPDPVEYETRKGKVRRIPRPESWT